MCSLSCLQTTGKSCIWQLTSGVVYSPCAVRSGREARGLERAHEKPLPWLEGPRVTEGPRRPTEAAAWWVWCPPLSPLWGKESPLCREWLLLLGATVTSGVCVQDLGLLPCRRVGVSAAVSAAEAAQTSRLKCSLSASSPLPGFPFFTAFITTCP